MKFLTIALLFVCSIGCGDEPTPNYSPDDKAFNVTFPAPPEQWATEFESPKYGKAKVLHVGVESAGRWFIVNYNDYPRELTDAEIESELKAAYTLPGTGAKVLDTSKVQMARTGAVQVVGKTGPIYSVGRYFIADKRRLYSLIVGGAEDPRKIQSQMDRFFNSFELTSPERAGSSLEVTK